MSLAGKPGTPIDIENIRWKPFNLLSLEWKKSTQANVISTKVNWLKKIIILTTSTMKQCISHFIIFIK
jgi:hypothetical protein